LSSTRRMGGYGSPSRVTPNRLSSISMLMVWTVTPPCRSFIRFRCSNRTPGGEHAKKNQQRNDFHFFLICQASMTPTLLVELGLEAIRHPRCLVPAAVLAQRAFMVCKAHPEFCHESPIMFDLAMPGFDPTVRSGPTCVVRTTLRVEPLFVTIYPESGDSLLERAEDA